MRMFTAIAGALLGAVLVASSAAARGFHYPATPRTPVIDSYFGSAVVDPYRWLENGTDPKVKAWAAAQNGLTLSYLESLSAFAPIAQRVASLAKTGTSRFNLVIAANTYIYLRQTPPQPHAALVVRTGLAGLERVLFNPSAGGAGPQPAIASVFVSRDGKRVAFTTQEGGAEDETLHVVETSSGTMLPDTITHVGGGTSPTALAWDGAGNGFVHTRFPIDAAGKASPFGIMVYHHTLGDEPNNDPYVFGKGLPKTTEMHLASSPNGSQTAAFVSAGDGPHDTIYVRSGNGDFVQVAAPADGIGSSAAPRAAFVGEDLFVVSIKRKPRGELVAIAPGSIFAQGRVVVPAGATVIEDVVPVAGGFITEEIDGGDSAARFFKADGSGRIRLAIPAQSRILNIAGDPSGGSIIIDQVAYNTARRWLRYDAAANTFARSGVETKVPGDYSKLVVRRVLVPSLDGSVKIPLEIVALPRVKRDGTAPTILTAYGAYGTISAPFFLGSNLAWIERGGVFAQAMIRGGGEYGEGWHLAAQRSTKTVSANDLAACARWLETHGYGNARHLGITGGSAGGFLMGLALTRNPDIYRAVVSRVGFYDLLRSERTPNGAFNIPEFGTVSDPAQFKWMLKQSPYENVVAGRSYPAILMTTGANDPRVDPYNSRKMVARLQAATRSGSPVMLIQKSGEGHGIGNSFQQRVRATSEMLTFFWDQLK